jgi:ubiquinone/menaquinone biosynthesis C-methylase UbiE
MDADLQRRVQRYGWDKAANHYELFWQQQLKPAQEKLMQAIQILPEEKILDIACGTGLVSLEAAKQAGPQGSVLGTDISDRMIDTARQIAAEKQIQHVEFKRMNAESLDLDDHSFDICICSLGLMYVPEPITAMREMYRVLKPGGRAAVLVWGMRDHCGWADIFEIVDRRVTSEVCPMFFHLGNPGVLNLSLGAAGFTSIREERFPQLLPYQNDEDACGAAFAGGPVALAYHKFSNEIKSEVHREYLDSISSWKTNSGYAVPGEFVIAVAGKKIQ